MGLMFFTTASSGITSVRIIEKIHGFLYKENGVSHIQRKSRNTENINQVHKFRPISRVKNPKRVFTS
jgi:hypothetical protein